MRKVAYLRIPKEPQYRASEFMTGLDAAGYIVNLKEPRLVNQGDLLLLWSRSGTNDTYATGFERSGGTVLIVENGYIGKDSYGHQYYAIAEGDHNGAGQWPTCLAKTWDSLGIPLKPWREWGDHILVCPSRFIGSPKMRQPFDWLENTLAALRAVTDRPIRVRPHPGNWQVDPPKVPLEEDLKNCHLVVIWGSTAGVHAITQGIPVISCAPHWILKACAGDTLTREFVEQPYIPSYVNLHIQLNRLVDAQWSLAEIRSGEAFTWLNE